MSKAFHRCLKTNVDYNIELVWIAFKALCWQKSNKMKTLKLEQEYIILRPRCIEFLKTLLSISNVGIWSTANDTHVVDIIKTLEKEAGEKFPFFMIWGQSQCQPCAKTRITRPDNPGVEALFKPLAIASSRFGIDIKRMLLVDDAPLKGCTNPTLNCIYPTSFNVMRRIISSLGRCYHISKLYIMSTTFVQLQALLFMDKHP